MTAGPSLAEGAAGTGLPTVDVVLLGRPNAGKSSLYNALTGGDAKVGNFPGVTVDLLEADLPLPGGGHARVIDLPGVYSLSQVVDPDSDEGQAHACVERLLAAKRPLLVAQIVDATQLALGLRMSEELLARGIPLVVIVTQRDVLAAQGRSLDEAGLLDALRVPVLVLSARDPDVRPRVAAALDQLVRGGLEKPTARTLDTSAISRAVIREPQDPGAQARLRRTRTARADELLLHPLLGPLLFLVVMGLLFSAVFLIAAPASRLIDGGVGWLSDLLTRVLGAGLVTSILGDAVLGGAGTVLTFLPQIVILTIVLELVDASGYLSRGAFLVDRLLRVAGLGGRSFVPLLTAHACAVPAITSTRIIRDPQQRLRTMLVLPLMTCSARLPTYGLLIAAFFTGRGAFFQACVFLALYLAGIVFAFVAALVLGRTIQRGGHSLPLVLEMPAYRVPQASVVLAIAWRSCKRFLRDVGTTIVVASVILWVLLKVPAPGSSHAPVSVGATTATAAMERSVAARIGRALEPITAPVGFDWRINVGLIGSFGARELMVSTLGVIFGIEDAQNDAAPLADKLRAARRPDGSPAYSPATGLSLMAFFVLACQCLSTVAALRRETKGWKWPAFVLGYTYVLAYVLALVVFHVARLAGL